MAAGPPPPALDAFIGTPPPTTPEIQMGSGVEPGESAADQIDRRVPLQPQQHPHLNWVNKSRWDRAPSMHNEQIHER